MSHVLLMSFPYQHVGEAREARAHGHWGRTRWSFVRSADGSIRQAQKGRRRRGAAIQRLTLKLPQEAWFLERLRRHHVAISSDSGAGLVWGVLAVRFRQRYESALTDMSSEEELQWRFLFSPLDFLSCEVVDGWMLHQPVPARPSARGPAMEEGLRGPGLARPDLPDLWSLPWAPLCGGGSVKLEGLVAAGVPRLESLQALLLPTCLAELARQGAWKHLGLLARWGPSCIPLADHGEWVRARSGLHLRLSPWESISHDAFSPSTFQHVAAELRQLASELGAAPRATLEPLVQWLQDCHCVVQRRGKARNGGSWSLYTRSAPWAGGLSILPRRCCRRCRLRRT